ncbi:hypothetical protein D3C73_1113890 [compost metagenome]
MTSKRGAVESFGLLIGGSSEIVRYTHKLLRVGYKLVPVSGQAEDAHALQTLLLRVAVRGSAVILHLADMEITCQFVIPYIGLKEISQRFFGQTDLSVLRNRCLGEGNLFAERYGVPLTGLDLKHDIRISHLDHIVAFPQAQTK